VLAELREGRSDARHRNGAGRSVAQRVLFYGYCDDIAATHSELGDAGMEVGPITKPFYNPGGEFKLTDPDGYAIWIAQI